MFVLAALVGIPFSFLAHFFFLPQVLKGSAAAEFAAKKGERLGLLDAGRVGQATTTTGVAKNTRDGDGGNIAPDEAGDNGHHQHEPHGPAYLMWLHRAGNRLLGGA